MLYPVELRVRLSVGRLNRLHCSSEKAWLASRRYEVERRKQIAVTCSEGGGDGDLAEPDLPEPWLRGTLQEVPRRAAGGLHALELAEEDMKRWCGGLTDEEINARPSGLPPVAFQLRHIARSLDRLLTYAEGRSLSDEQMANIERRNLPRAPAAMTCSQNWKQPSAQARCTDSGARRRCAGAGQECWPATFANNRRWFAGACRGSHSTSRRTSHHDGENCAGTRADL